MDARCYDESRLITGRKELPTMEIANLILSYLKAVLIWPVAGTVLVLYFLVKYKTPIESFLNRVQKGEGFGVKLELNQIDQQKEVKEVAAVIPMPEGVKVPSTSGPEQDEKSKAINFII